MLARSPGLALKEGLKRFTVTAIRTTGASSFSRTFAGSATPRPDATPGEIDGAVREAAAAAPELAGASAEQIGAFLRKIATNIDDLEEELVETAVSETALLDTRIRGERERTTTQLRKFADLVEEGSWVDARLDVGLGAGRDLRRMLRPLGPAVVFGASNFPLAFSVAGGDTAAALAARCPVVHKAHPAHQRTAELVASAIVSAAEESPGIPSAGTFSMVHGTAPRVGMELVEHPLVRVGGFTGSLRAGRALFDAANSRARPIPFFAEMGSVNPVTILPGALASKWQAIAAGLASSLCLGAGQFCTNPGLVVTGANGDDATLVSRFCKDLSRAVERISPQDMLTRGIAAAYEEGSKALASRHGVEVLTSPFPRGEGGGAVLRVSAADFLADAKAMQEEVFGPLTLVVDCSVAEGGTGGDEAVRESVSSVVQSLEGQLTATVWGSSDDLSFASNAGLLRDLEERAGRVLFNGFPTGVEVSSAMNHGGPYPAATIDETSVGMEAIRRFTRPVCWQDCPDALLPPELQDSNPRDIARKVNEVLRRGAVEEHAAKQAI